MNDIDGYAFVHKQPQSEEEISACHRALEACPVDAIGSEFSTFSGQGVKLVISPSPTDSLQQVVPPPPPSSTRKPSCE